MKYVLDCLSIEQLPACAIVAPIASVKKGSFPGQAFY